MGREWTARAMCVCVCVCVCVCIFLLYVLPHACTPLSRARAPAHAARPAFSKDMEATLRKEEERRREMEAEEYAAEQLRLKEQVTNA